MASEHVVPTTDGLTLWAKAVGDGPIELIVPGLPGDDESLAPLAESRSVVVYHPRGRGRSGSIRDHSLVTLENELNDMRAVQDFFGVEACALMGASYMGATVALYAARERQRVTRVVQVCPMAPRRFDYWAAGSPEAEEYARKATGRVEPADVAKLAKARQGGMEQADPANYTRLLNRVSLARRMGNNPRRALGRARYDPGAFENEWVRNVEAWFQAFFKDIGDYDWRRLIAGMTVPALVIHGSEDGPEQARGEWCMRENARLLVMEGVGHFPEWEAPEVFLTAVDCFLGGEWPEGTVTPSN